MRSPHARVAAVIAAGSLAGSAWAQNEVIASLPWTFGLTAGPNGTDYEPPQDHLDLWIVEDFSISTPAALSRFESYGTVFPAPVTVLDVTVRILDAQPPDGNVVLSSVPGSGKVTPVGLNSIFSAQFGDAFLPAGAYTIIWNASTLTNQGKIAIFWAQEGQHAVGGGEPENAMLWNPGGGWGFPDNIKPIPDDLDGTGQTGVNFWLIGEVLCYADCNADGVVNIFDFLCFQGKVTTGDPAADCNGDGAINIFDFLCFQGAVTQGCP
jgi:hypothetical protein